MKDALEKQQQGTTAPLNEHTTAHSAAGDAVLTQGDPQAPNPSPNPSADPSPNPTHTGSSRGAATGCSRAAPPTQLRVGLLRSEKVFAYQYVGKRYDCGSKEGFLEANVELALRHPQIGAGFRAYLKALDLG